MVDLTLPDDSPNPDAGQAAERLVARVQAWQHRHPLARRLPAADVGGLGVIALPFDAPDSGGKPRPLFHQPSLVPGLSHRALVEFAQRHAVTYRPGPAEWPLREVERADASTEPAPQTRYLLTVAITEPVKPGAQPRRLLIAPEGAAIWGPRPLSKARLAGAAVVLLLILIGIVWGLRGRLSPGAVTSPPAIPASSPASSPASVPASAMASAPRPTVVASTPQRAAAPASAPAVAPSRPAAASAAASAAVPAASVPARSGPSPSAVASAVAPVASAPKVSPAPTRAASASAAPAASAPPTVTPPASAASAASAVLPPPPRLLPMPALRGAAASAAAAAASDAASAPASAASPAVPTGPHFALVSVPSKKRAGAEETLARIRKLLGPAIGNLQAQIMPTPEGFVVTIWPLPTQADAEQLAEVLARRGVPMKWLEF